MTVLRVILGDQCSMRLPTLRGGDQSRDLVLMMEVADETQYAPHHKKKIAFILAAMRHHAAALMDAGWRVDYVRLDDPANTGSFTGEVARAVDRHKITKIVITHPGEYRVLAMIKAWAGQFGIPVDILDDNRFLCSLSVFKDWAAGRKNLRMEFFYRDMRLRHNILLNDDRTPVGGAWNFDADNRKALPKTARPPLPTKFQPDQVTKDVIDLVAARFAKNFGDLDGFHFAVTRDQALQVLDEFIQHRLPLFGDYQDAMKQGEPWLYHSHLSFYLNNGLLDPLEVIQAAEDAYHRGHAPLNAAEGFIRQILGWREYVRGIYWLKMPDYARENALGAKRDLPDFYWDAKTDMNCLHQVVTETKQNAYAHHIQRLMITGNFALLAGIDPAQVNEWYLAVYADAYEWVELPNVSGMILYADGGYLASKPYAAGGAYINRMSDYCASCRYNVKEKTGPHACPWNNLYWAFFIRHQEKLRGNPRLAITYKNIAAMTPQARAESVARADAFLNSLPSGSYR